jgi:uroporphyrinogen-III synthase
LIVRLLLTRPEADAERTATALRARGHEVIVAPIFPGVAPKPFSTRPAA